MGELYRDLSVLFSKDQGAVNLNGIDGSNLTVPQNGGRSVSRQMNNCLKILVLTLLTTFTLTFILIYWNKWTDKDKIIAKNGELMTDSKLQQEIPIRVGQLNINLTSNSSIESTPTVPQGNQVIKVGEDEGRVDRRKSESCGGVILVPDKINLHYVADKDENCVWIIWTRGLRTVGYKFQSIKGHNLTPLTLHLFKAESISNSSFEPSLKVIVAEDLNKDLEFGNSFGILMVTSKRGQGFHLHLHCVGYCGGDPNSVVSVESLTVTPGQNRTFAHPSDRSKNYENNERKLILLGPREGHRVEINFEFVDVYAQNKFSSEAANHDYLSLFKFSRRFGVFILFQKYEGKLERLRHANFVGEENEAMLIFFYSDHGTNSKGFKFNYTYIPL